MYHEGSTASEKKLTIPTTVFAVISMALAALLWWHCNVQIKKMKGQNISFFGYNLDLFYRRLLLMRQIKYMAAFDLLFTIWVVLNWGSVAVSHSFSFQKNHAACKAAAMLVVFSFTGTAYFYILITITILGIMKVGFHWRCFNGWLCDQFYPIFIDSYRQYSAVFRNQCVVVFIIVIVSTGVGIPKSGRNDNSDNPNRVDAECWVGTDYSFLIYAPLFIALILALISVSVAWLKRNCRCTNDSESTMDLLPPGDANDVTIGREFALRVSFFAVAFWSGWSWAVGTRAHNWAGQHSLPLWMLCGHHYTNAITPSRNYLVWHKWNPGDIAIVAAPPRPNVNIALAIDQVNP